MAFADQLRPFFDQLRELVALRAAIGRDDQSTTLIESLALDGLLVVTRHPKPPSLLKVVRVDRTRLGQHFGQRLDHHVIVEASCSLLLRKFEQLLKAILCASERSFERADSFEQMLLKGVSPRSRAPCFAWM